MKAKAHNVTPHTMRRASGRRRDIANAIPAPIVTIAACSATPPSVVGRSRSNTVPLQQSPVSAWRQTVGSPTFGALADRRSCWHRI